MKDQNLGAGVLSESNSINKSLLVLGELLVKNVITNTQGTFHNHLVISDTNIQGTFLNHLVILRTNIQGAFLNHLVILHTNI